MTEGSETSSLTSESQSHHLLLDKDRLQGYIKQEFIDKSDTHFSRYLYKADPKLRILGLLPDILQDLYMIDANTSARPTENVVFNALSAKFPDIRWDTIQQIRRATTFLIDAFAKIAADSETKKYRSGYKWIGHIYGYVETKTRELTARLREEDIEDSSEEALARKVVDSMETLQTNLERMIPVANLWMRHYTTIAARADVKMNSILDDLQTRITLLPEEQDIYEDRLQTALEALNTKTGLSAITDLINLELMLPKDASAIESDEPVDSAYSSLAHLFGFRKKVAPDEQDNVPNASDVESPSITRANLLPLGRKEVRRTGLIQVQTIRNPNEEETHSNDSLRSAQAVSNGSSDTHVPPHIIPSRKNTDSTDGLFQSTHKKDSPNGSLSHPSTPEKLQAVEEDFGDAPSPSLLSEQALLLKDTERYNRITQSLADLILEEFLEEELPEVESDASMELIMEKMANSPLSDDEVNSIASKDSDSDDSDLETASKKRSYSEEFIADLELEIDAQIQMSAILKARIEDLMSKISNITPYQQHLLERLNDANPELRQTCRDNYSRYFFKNENDKLLYEAIIELGEIESFFG